jgi:thiol-disulfide isomerase/thioredoxin
MSFGPVSENVLASKLEVVKGLERLGRISDALELARATKAFCLREHPENVKLLSDVDWYLSWLLLQSGSVDKAETLARESYERATTRIEDDVYAKQARSVLAATLIAQGRLEETSELYGKFPTYPGLDKEYDLIESKNPDTNDIQLIVFWEEWCPFCDRLMGRVERLYREYHDEGIDVIGVTNLWKNSSKRDAEYFLWQHDVTFPCIKEGGKAFDHFDATGVPSIRLVYKGNLIWDRDVPTVEPMSKHMLEGLKMTLAGPVAN